MQHACHNQRHTCYRLLDRRGRPAAAATGSRCRRRPGLRRRLGSRRRGSGCLGSLLCTCKAVGWVESVRSAATATVEAAGKATTHAEGSPPCLPPPRPRLPPQPPCRHQAGKGRHVVSQAAVWQASRRRQQAAAAHLLAAPASVVAPVAHGRCSLCTDRSCGCLRASLGLADVAAPMQPLLSSPAPKPCPEHSAIGSSPSSSHPGAHSSCAPKLDVPQLVTAPNR